MPVMQTRTATAEEVATEIAQAAATAAAWGRRFTVAISPAAATPDVARALVRGNVHVFLADTRFDACGGCAAEVRALLGQLPRGNLHFDVADHADTVRAACAYEQELRAFFGLAVGDLPRFDAIVLQAAPDGGTSGVPARSRAVEETCRLAVSNRASAGSAQFVTLTPPVIQHAGRLFVTAGAPHSWRTAA